jgi:subtilase family serine protease
VKDGSKRRTIVAAVCLVLSAGCASHGGASLVPDASSGFAARPSPGGVSARGSIWFVVALPLRNEPELDRVLATISDPDSPQYRHFLSATQFESRYAPAPGRLRAIAFDLQKAGFWTSISDQAVSAGGAQSQIERYFHTSLYRNSEGAFASRGPLAYPSTLASAAATVIGLDDVKPPRESSHLVPAATPHNVRGPLGPYFPTDLKQAYQMPAIADANGQGVTIAIVNPSPVSATDMKTFFSKMGSAQPRITVVKIDGGRIFGSEYADETTLDVEQSGGIAPMANIVLYDLRDLTYAHIYDAYASIVKTDTVTIVNSSFGACELDVGGANEHSLLDTFDAVFKEGVARGITWVAASGDYGADDCGNADQVGVDWPGVSPYVLAVGGTNLVTAAVKGSHDSSYVRESAYHDVQPPYGGLYWGSGGGYSTVYARPFWQNGFVDKAARGVPDVSLHMGGYGLSGSHPCKAETCSKDDSSDLEFLRGKWFDQIGTSAASPDIVGLLALESQIAGTRLGDVHAMLYAAAKHPGLFHTGIPGNNGFPTTKGLWDPVLGLGTPKAAYKLVGAKHPAGIPGSPSNP